ncbi:Di-glucose binding within endoplasmic reticulum [Lentzea fradiae]|uniref:Di-glucose binding within endoplasmic reticulum n=1 Tax=Lentzea fradiae TaxID=200378 RepID=A0A1G7UMK5_9PSEU|nr:malectin domain-containing carbohydrate-binding protein [Lentzea fradiae]SDG47950.1 Di-glucose binding within endoplasmic reticulum [Lentzea fradiae]
MRKFIRMITAGAAAAALLLGTAQTSLAADPVVVDAGGAGDIGVGGLVDTKPADKRSNVVFSRTVKNRIDPEIWYTSRYLESSYELTGLTAGASYELRLYFLDWYFSRPGQRVFDVDVNGTRVLSDFDIIGTAVAAGADGPQTAFGVEKDIPVTADADGKVRVDFLRGAVDQPQINALVIVPAA